MWQLLIPAAMQAAGSIFGGMQAKKAADYEAGQLRRQADLAAASGQREAYYAGKEEELIASRLLARAAASGAGASDPGILRIMADIAAEGAFNQQTALYNAEEKSNLLESQAAARKYEGRSAMVGGLLKAGGHIAGGYANVKAWESQNILPSMRDKYDPDSRYGGPVTSMYG